MEASFQLERQDCTFVEPDGIEIQSTSPPTGGQLNMTTILIT